MRNKRSPEDLCLLCRKCKATATNSHFTPMGMIKSNTGKRNKEETYSIDPFNNISVYYGRENLKSIDIEIKEDPHSMDYIFCQKCEDLLADVLESPAIGFLNQDFRNSNKSKKFAEKKLMGVSYKTSLNFDSSLFHAFIYSIIWRQCLQQKLAGFDKVLPEVVMDNLRELIYNATYSIQNEKQNLLHSSYKYNIVTSPNIPYSVNKEGYKVSTITLIGPYFKKSYPHIFGVNEFLIFFYSDGFANNIINRNFPFLPDVILSEELLNGKNFPIKIGLISDEDFENFQLQIWSERAILWRRIYLLDDFRQAFYLHVKSPLPSNFEMRLNYEIESEFLILLDEVLKKSIKVEFDGLISSYYSIAMVNIPALSGSNKLFGYACLLARKHENKEEWGYDILFAVKKK